MYNVNADTAAAAGQTMKVRKLAFVSDVPGLLMDMNDPVVAGYTADRQCAQAEETGVVGGGMLPAGRCVERSGRCEPSMVDGLCRIHCCWNFTKGVGTELCRW